MDEPTGQSPQRREGGVHWLLFGLAVAADIIAVVSVVVSGSGSDGIRSVALTFGAVSVVGASGYLLICKGNDSYRPGSAAAVLLAGCVAAAFGLVGTGSAKTGDEQSHTQVAPTSSPPPATDFRPPADNSDATSGAASVPPIIPSVSLEGTKPRASVLPPSTYFSDLPLLEGHPLDFDKGVAKLGRDTYDHSVFLYCKGLDESSRFAWDLSEYVSIEATFGVPSDAPNASSVKIEVSITGDDGRDLISPFFVQVGSPAKKKIELNGSVMLKVKCGGVSRENGRSTNSSILAVGDGVLA